MNSVRDITLNYFKLTFSRRLAIAEKFNLLEEEDIDQPDHERFRRVLSRAKERSLLREIDSEITIELQESYKE
ncbi:hypothetical protein J9305_12675 [Leptospira interrogans]|uniref:GTPase-associated adaptor domain-containing protein n=1 Tax=Leptospira interrogans serovar Pyrogenes str. 200701872 TaxID=1193029 RepID=M6ZM16_LEPIR|nr:MULTISPECIES: hypothetical protein [Leptospira]EMP07131.1 hypothetical protein LEP1GSC124_5349 [Leptospira interrogans serovar Pyrogenes str. 200701872]EJP04850.1 hypothetical protein LEP1GSC007_2870 [Leptospira interrogans serovar Bulgarica str. Mallika]EMO79420.1 hypothetical protein LEP1GSC126_1271 [Leptospira kirschneri str. 200801774]EMO81753.1 hypothetical protein LEP1GSC126_4367 [Leptospira kirschneri str. 200801774]EMO82687.1 hypothetical protein LEP1GSC126_2746 [Leptospira kirschne